MNYAKAYMVKGLRISFHKSKKMFLKGIRGHVVLGILTPEQLELFYVGELFYIGKHTSFGFGKYCVAEEQER